MATLKRIMTSGLALVLTMSLSSGFLSSCTEREKTDNTLESIGCAENEREQCQALVGLLEFMEPKERTETVKVLKGIPKEKRLLLSESMGQLGAMSEEKQLQVLREFVRDPNTFINTLEVINKILRKKIHTPKERQRVLEKSMRCMEDNAAFNVVKDEAGHDVGLGIIPLFPLGYEFSSGASLIAKLDDVTKIKERLKLSNFKPDRKGWSPQYIYWGFAFHKEIAFFMLFSYTEWRGSRWTTGKNGTLNKQLKAAGEKVGRNGAIEYQMVAVDPSKSGKCQIIAKSETQVFDAVLGMGDHPYAFQYAAVPTLEFLHELQAQSKEQSSFPKVRGRFDVLIVNSPPNGKVPAALRVTDELNVLTKKVEILMNHPGVEHLYSQDGQGGKGTQGGSFAFEKFDLLSPTLTYFAKKYKMDGASIQKLEEFLGRVDENADEDDEDW